MSSGTSMQILEESPAQTEPQYPHYNRNTAQNYPRQAQGCLSALGVTQNANHQPYDGKGNIQPV